MVLVSAPVGAGKTTALADWASRRGDSVAWRSPTERHDDPAVFWRSVSDALGLPPERHVPGPEELAVASSRATSGDCSCSTTTTS